VTFHSNRFKTLFLATLVSLAGSAAYADDAAPAPTPAALEAAKSVIVGSGMTRSFDLVVPQMFGELERNVLATRPELKDNLHTVLLALVPEFIKSEQAVVDGAALALAKRMNEQQLKDTAAFFNSPSGKKYVESEPLAYQDIVGVVNNWRQKLSVDVLTRTREEMKKKGVTL
jgi:hypothetical protein